MRRGKSILFALVPGTCVLLAPAAAQDRRPSAPTYEQTVAAVAACGVPAAEVRITYEEELQSDLVRIGDLGSSDEARFRCVRKSVHPYYILDVYSAPQSDAYSEFADREYRRQAKAEAVVWLGARGMLGKVPRYDPAKGLSAFARALEAACSVRKGSTLETLGEEGLTFRLSFARRAFEKDTYDQFNCLTKMIAASDADKHGVQLMFVGNEAYQTENQR